MSSYTPAVQRADHAVKRAASNPALEMLQRAGYVARGVLYAVMGALALGLALRVGGSATDQSGSLVTIAGGTFGKVLLLVFAVSLGAYSIWGFVRAVLDPLHRGDKPAGVAERLGFAWSGIAYAGLALFAVELFLGSGRSQDSTQSAMAKILAYPAGHWAVVVIGLVAIAVGLGQFVLAYKATFKQDLKRGEMNQSEKKVVDALGRIGFAARGVVFTLVGWFVLQGGIHGDASRVHGFGGAFVFLLTQPHGHVLVGLVAIGFIALGFHSFAAARWTRMMGSEY